MVIGILKDIKKGENRVIATPGEVATLIGDGNTVKVQKGAGEKAGFEDQAYAEAGAVLVDTAEEIYGTCEFVTKVKEFEPSEFDLLRDCLLYTSGIRKMIRWRRSVRSLSRKASKYFQSLRLPVRD